MHHTPLRCDMPETMTNEGKGEESISGHTAEHGHGRLES
jgi:hypothetical protein